MVSGNTAHFIDYVEDGDRKCDSLGLTLLVGTSSSIKEKNHRDLLKAESLSIEKETALF